MLASYFPTAYLTQANITSISWSLDPTTDTVVALDLDALAGDNPCPNSMPSCSASTLNLPPTLATSGDVSCSISGETGECFEDLGMSNISFVLVSMAAPEPSTWAWMVVGLVGLGVAGDDR